jgi:hypothetical protein
VRVIHSAFFFGRCYSSGWVQIWGDSFKNLLYLTNFACDLSVIANVWTEYVVGRKWE